MKMKYEKEMTNKAYKEKKPREWNHMEEKNSHVLGISSDPTAIGAVGIKMHVENPTVIIAHVLIGDLNDEKSKRLKLKFEENYKLKEKL